VRSLRYGGDGASVTSGSGGRCVSVTSCASSSSCPMMRPTRVSPRWTICRANTPLMGVTSDVSSAGSDTMRTSLPRGQSRSRCCGGRNGGATAGATKSAGKMAGVARWPVRSCGRDHNCVSDALSAASSLAARGERVSGPAPEPGQRPGPVPRAGDSSPQRRRSETLDRRAGRVYGIAP
jgi:hypothetical protein